ncbi:hypothetical protein [Spirosoma horti]
MRPLLILSLMILAWASINPISLLAQNVSKNLSYDVTFIADGKLVNLTQGIPHDAKTFNMKGKLTPESKKRYPQLKSEVAINKAVISLVRNTRRVAFVNWTGNESLSSLPKLMQAGDRFVVQFDDVDAQSKDGINHKLANFKFMQITVY